MAVLDSLLPLDRLNQPGRQGSAALPPTHPYTKIDFVQRELGVSRVTATKYLDTLAEGGFVRKQKIGRGNYYINVALNAVLQSQPPRAPSEPSP